MTYSIQTASQRGAYKRSIVLSIFLAAIVAMLPGQVLAQGLNCPININVDFQGSSGPFELNEDIPMQVSFEAGFSPVPVEVQIDTFKYLLDCDGLDFDQCQATPPVGNTVELVESSVSTNCTINGVDTSRTGHRAGKCSNRGDSELKTLSGRSRIDCARLDRCASRREQL